MSEQIFTVEAPQRENGETHFTVRGVAPEPINHYDLARIVKRQMDFVNVDFDPEQGEFFAYTPDRSTAGLLAATLEAIAGNQLVCQAQARHTEFVDAVEQILANQAEAGEFYNERRAQADGIVLGLRDRGLI